MDRASESEEAEKKRQEQKIQSLEKAYEEQSKAMKQMMENSNRQLEQNRLLMEQLQQFIKNSDGGERVKPSKSKEQ